VLEDPADPHELRVERSSDGDTQVVQAAGDLDAASADRLRGAIDDVFAEGHASVVVDMSEISFIDSSGLSVLIHAYKQAADRDGTLTLRAPSDPVIRLLDLTGQRDRFLN
jgi:anti-sigma B factor antagonist